MWRETQPWNPRKSIVWKGIGATSSDWNIFEGVLFFRRENKFENKEQHQMEGADISQFFFFWRPSVHLTINGKCFYFWLHLPPAELEIHRGRLSFVLASEKAAIKSMSAAQWIMKWLLLCVECANGWARHLVSGHWRFSFLFWGYSILLFVVLLEIVETRVHVCVSCLSALFSSCTKDWWRCGKKSVQVVVDLGHGSYNRHFSKK